VLVPPHAGVLSAVGLAAAPDRREALASVLRPADALAAADVRALVEGLAARAGAGVERRTWVRARYAGQGHELEVPVHDGDDGAMLAARFAAVHATRSGFTLPRTVEIVSARHAASTPGTAPQFSRPQVARDGAEVDAAAGEFAHRDDRWARADDVLRGPATIALADATVLVPPGWTARALAIGGWMLEA
jgi:N-methylhydantoinase A